MAKQVFFSFHYQDVIDFRANVVRNHWLTKPDREEAGYFDESLWEATKRTGVDQLKDLIHSGLDGTSVTVVSTGNSAGDSPATLPIPAVSAECAAKPTPATPPAGRGPRIARDDF